jgi:hypothetical protein
MVIQKMRPRENVKISYDPTFQSFFHQGTIHTSPDIVPLLKSRDEIFFKGRVVTLDVMNSLIIVNKVLINNQIH